MNRKSMLGLLAIVAISLLGLVQAQEPPNSTATLRAFTCPVATVAGSSARTNAACPTWSWKAVLPNRGAELPLVAVCTTACNWNNGTITWRRPNQVGTTDRIVVCRGVIPSNPDNCTPQTFEAGILPAAPTQPPTDPNPTVTLTAAPLQIAYRGTVTLTWTSTNVTATSCPISGEWGGTVFPSGTLNSAPLEPGPKVFNIRCENPNGVAATASASVNVAQRPPAPQILDFVPNTPAVTLGNAITVTWRTTNATSCTADWTSSVGIQQATPLAIAAPTSVGKKFLKLVCSNGIDSTESTMGYDVNPVPVPVSIVPPCMPDEEDVIQKDWGGRGKVAWAKLANPLGKLDYKAVYYCPDGNGGTLQVAYATDSMQVLKSAALGQRYDKAAARAKCESECIVLPAGATKDEVDAWKVMPEHRSEILGVIGR